MMAFKASARRHVRRQSAGAGVVASRSVARFSGGKSGHFGRCVFDQKREEKMRSDPGLGEPWVFGGQSVEMQDGFQPFEGQFDLPANAIEPDERLRREGERVERGDQDHVSGGLQGARIDVVLVFASVVAGDVAGALGAVGRLGGNDEAHGQRLEAPPRLVNYNRHVDLTRRVRLGEDFKPIDGYSGVITQVQAVPRQSNEEIGAAVANGAHGFRLGIAAIRKDDVVGLVAHTIQRFAFVKRGDCEIGDPLSRGIVTKVQPKAGPAWAFNARAVDDADPVLARSLSRGRVAAGQQGFAECDEPIAANTKTFEQRNVGNIDNSRRRGFCGEPAQGAPARRVSQHQTKQIRSALDMPCPMKRAMSTRQTIDRLGSTESGHKSGVGLRRNQIRQGKKLHSKLESDSTIRVKIALKRRVNMSHPAMPEVQ